MNNELFILTGAAGFLGNHIVDELLEKNRKVRALVLSGDPAAKYIPKEVEQVEGDLTDMDSLDPLFDVPADTDLYVIHCASMVTVNPEFNQKLMDINVGGTKNMIAQCLKNPQFKKMVYVSSTGAIPELPKGQKIKEVDHFDSEDERIVGWYSKSKAMATQAVLDAVKNDGLNACVVHPSGIIGPKDFALGAVTGNVIRVLNGEMPVGMGGSFNLCDVRDLAHGVVMGLEKGRQGECYILGNEEVTFKEFCKTLERECGGKGPIFFLPIPFAKMIAAQAEKKALKTGEPPVMTTFMVYNLGRNNSFDYSKAQQELGYTTRPYKETLTDLAGWLKENHLIGGKGTPDFEERSAAVAQSEGILNRGQVNKIATFFNDSDFVAAVACAANKRQLGTIVRLAGIDGFSDDMLDECWKYLSLSQNEELLSDMFQGKDYSVVSDKLKTFGIQIDENEYDMLKDLLRAANDSCLVKELIDIKDPEAVYETLQEKGYKRISKDFLKTMLENVSGIFNDVIDSLDEIRGNTNDPVQDKFCRVTNTFYAMTVITELIFGIKGAINPVYILTLSAAICQM